MNRCQKKSRNGEEDSEGLERGRRCVTGAGPGVGAENHAAVVGDSDDGRPHGVGGVQVHVVHRIHRSSSDRMRRGGGGRGGRVNEREQRGTCAYFPREEEEEEGENLLAP